MYSRQKSVYASVAASLPGNEFISLTSICVIPQIVAIFGVKESHVVAS